MTLLTKLTDAILSGKNIPLEHSLIIASGIESQREGEIYLRKFDKIHKNFRKYMIDSYGYEISGIKKGHLLHHFLSNPVKYKRNLYRFTEAIDARLNSGNGPHGNCVALTCMYNSLALREGLNVSSVVTPNHVFTLLKEGGKNTYIENTNKKCFDINTKKRKEVDNLYLIESVLNWRLPTFLGFYSSGFSEVGNSSDKISNYIKKNELLK